VRKTMIGPRLRRLRRQSKQTQAEMARALGVSTAYVNLLENNQRSLSVQMLMTLSDVYGVNWRDLIMDDASNRLADLRNALRDPMFGDDAPDLQELRAAIDHAPGLVDQFVRLHTSHRLTVERMMRLGRERMPDDLLASSPETIIHDFFRNHSNYFEVLEHAAEQLRSTEPCDTDEVYPMLKERLRKLHGVKVRTVSTTEIKDGLRVYNDVQREVQLSEALDYQNRTFQLAHVVCLLEQQDVLDDLTSSSGISSEAGRARCNVELANYFAAAVMMPYGPFHATAERTRYDIDRTAAAFGVSFEQVCQRLTTLQKDGVRGVPFFFLRVDKAGNVTKRFNSTSFNLAEQGGSCPVWNIHTAFRTPGTILPQFVELPDGERYFTISRTTDRPVLSHHTQDQRLALTLGCELKYAERITYISTYNLDDEQLFSPIGINCHLCPRKACPQRAHQPLFMELPIDTNRRGNTRYES
jgi:predicted transcriptional regulator/transcriptional regulator with XRE-family HTH domain